MKVHKIVNSERWQDNVTSWDYYSFFLYHNVTGEGHGSLRYSRAKLEKSQFDKVYGFFSLGYRQDRARLDFVVEPCGPECNVFYTLMRYSRAKSLSFHTL